MVTENVHCLSGPSEWFPLLFQIHQSSHEFLFKTVSSTRRLGHLLTKADIQSSVSGLISESRSLRWEGQLCALCVVHMWPAHDRHVTCTWPARHLHVIGMWPVLLRIQSLKRATKDVGDVKWTTWCGGWLHRHCMDGWTCNHYCHIMYVYTSMLLYSKPCNSHCT